MLYAYHHSWEKLYRSPFGAVEEGSTVTLRIWAKTDQTLHKAHLILDSPEKRQVFPMKRVGQIQSGFVYEARLNLPETPCLLHYHFILYEECYGHVETYYYGNNRQSLGGAGALSSEACNSYQILVYKKGFSSPKWLREGILYQIFPDRFYRKGDIVSKPRDYYYHRTWDELPRHNLTDPNGDYASRDFFGGNLWGIQEKLPYLASLGVTILYLNPIFDAYSNHKYDTGNYLEVDVMFGGNKAFQSLCEKAKASGIRILLDGVFSHSGSDSIYFNKESRYPGLGAYESKNSIYFPWYRFHNYPEDYECWWGIKTLPNINELTPSYVEYMLTGPDSVVRHWLRLGASGWRLDVADELPSPFIKTLYRTVKEEGADFAVIGEVWEDASHKVSYGELRDYLLGEEMDSVMNYPFRHALFDFLLGHSSGEMFTRRIMSLMENYPLTVFYSLMNMLSTHDLPRALSVLGGAPLVQELSREEQSRFFLSPEQKTLAKKRMKLASLVQFSFPGLPSIYYGDEAGMEGMGDPFNRGPYPWGREEPDLFHWFQYLTTLRQKEAVLKSGFFQFLSEDEDSIAWLRFLDEGRDVFGDSQRGGPLLFAINRHPEKAKDITLFLAAFGIYRLCDINGKEKASHPLGIFTLKLPPLGYEILMPKPLPTGEAPTKHD